ncbi:hypothetical protein M422DRAFT_273087 [Sphaerobolus stellatus SS14]|uniref:Ubiquitin 3 binding protein But2 C-terminal domain-containing protein n=1 Tax=Sphaerobolus stellatus (strain SS14) TaxID=990650 RepID=A0A0C9TVS5_SPHS4|nr:hypothetical protein M422DRAFT_273087 [Sphaerobolus stellatus SS14]
MFDYWRKSGYQVVSTASDLDQYETPKQNRRSLTNVWLPALTLLIAVGCTLFNVANLITPLLTAKDIPFAALPRPNHFIGLERVNFAAHPFPDTKITTFPWTLASIDRTRPKYVFPVDPRRKFTYFGTISPEDRNLLATNEISTVAQFRVRDWGMEWCRLKLSLPENFQYHPDQSDKGERERNWFLEGDTSDLEVWELDSTEWIDPTGLSYDTRPRRKAHIFSWKVQPNKTVYSREFRCLRDSIGTFELFCVSPECRIDIWQDKQLPAVDWYRSSTGAKI